MPPKGQTSPVHSRMTVLHGIASFDLGQRKKRSYKNASDGIRYVLCFDMSLILAHGVVRIFLKFTQIREIIH